MTRLEDGGADWRGCRKQLPLVVGDALRRTSGGRNSRCREAAICDDFGLQVLGLGDRDKNAKERICGVAS